MAPVESDILFHESPDSPTAFYIHSVDSCEEQFTEANPGAECSPTQEDHGIGLYSYLSIYCDIGGTEACTFLIQRDMPAGELAYGDHYLSYSTDGSHYDVHRFTILDPCKNDKI